VAKLTCRVLPFQIASGPHNMAADEALLDSAVEGLASLRFYSWSDATVSLGYFQPHTLRYRDPLLAKLPCVRRMSGGATLVHHFELTYCLAIPAGKIWQGETSWLIRMHRVILEALHRHDIPAGLVDEPVRKGPNLCFLDHTRGDVVLRHAKIAGSAQRRRHGALLQHGAVLLAESPHAPVLPGIQELEGKTLSAEQLSSSLRATMASHVEWSLTEDDWSHKELRRIRELIAVKYSDPRWTLKR
jgi:lipoyl(octanoyl) transferase